jgi:hypothetical protein
MVAGGTGFQAAAAPDTNRGVGRAWLALCVALGVHVADEACSGFLAVYNPTVVSLRGKLPWLPLPVFRFETWIAGLIIAIIALFALSAFVFRGVRWTRPASYAFAIRMAANALGHTIGTMLGRTTESVHFPRPMPGFYSSPLLLAASIHLLFRLRSSRSSGVQPALPAK